MTEQARRPDVEGLEERLDDVEEEIDEAERLRRREAHEDERRYYESGTEHPELDDQTITPPG